MTSQNLPAVLNSAICPEITKQRQRARQLLAQHEILFPKLFTSLRNSLHPLVGFQIEEGELKSRRRLKLKEIGDGSDGETDEEPIIKTD